MKKAVRQSMSMADLIAERRKEKGMTQKQLADRLGVTDKAVSKWERGNGQPDIGTLEPLAEALEITVTELLRGKLESPADALADEGGGKTDDAIVKKTLDYAYSVYKARSRSLPRAAMLAFLALGLAGIITTAIVDVAINGGFTWSLLPICAIVFAWLCLLPLLAFPGHRVNLALLSTSVFILPFLYVICRLTGGSWFAPVAIPMALAGLVMLWLVRAVFATRLSVWSKLAVSVLIGAAGDVAIDFILGAVLDGAGFDVWTLASVAILVVVAIVLFATGYARRKR